MKNNKKIQWFVSTVSLLALDHSAIANTTQIETPTQEKLNMDSLKSIEGSWLKVPGMCKAKGFNANPLSLEIKAQSTQAQETYLAYDLSYDLANEV